MLGLTQRIGFGDLRARLAATETQMAKEPLALSHLQIHSESPFEKRGEALSIPQVARQSRSFWRLPQYRSNDLKLGIIQASSSPATLVLHQSGQAIALEAPDPVFHSARSVAQQCGNLRTRHALSHQQNPVESMVITRLLAATNLILQSRASSPSSSTSPFRSWRPPS